MKKGVKQNYILYAIIVILAILLVISIVFDEEILLEPSDLKLAGQGRCDEGSGIGTIHFIDPVAGNDDTGDGTSALPWKTLAGVAERGYLQDDVAPGDKVCLLNGIHGQAFIRNVNHITPITIIGKNDDARVTSLDIRDSSNIIFENFKVSPSFEGITLSEHKPIIDFQDNSELITLRKLEVFTAPYETARNWNANDWNNKTRNGISLTNIDPVATNIIIEDSLIHVVDKAIQLAGSNVIVRNNVIKNDRRDSISILASSASGVGPFLIQDNQLLNKLKTDEDTHHDGIQFNQDSLSLTATIEKNIIIMNNGNHEYPNLAAIDQQGIFGTRPCNCTIRNNMIAVANRNALINIKANNARVTSNTFYGTRGKLTLRGSNNKVYNNLIFTDAFNAIIFQEGSNNQQGNNIVDTPSRASIYVVNPSIFNFRLKYNSPAINVGNNANAPPDDFEGTPRPQGAIADVGGDERDN